MCPTLLVLLCLAFFGILSPVAHSTTVATDVSALNVMYNSMNSPSQLTDWKSSGGDPCGESWKGIECSGSSVTEIKLSGLGLTGSMGYQLSNLKSVTNFDMSKNNLKGDIPYQLPPNVLQLDLSQNGFTGGVPYSISGMTDLEYLNLGRNKLNGQLNDMFGELHKLTSMDLSFNTLSGNLPQSFGSLLSLKTLNLQNNRFTGSINVLADLPLNDLNVENNKFTGWIPDALNDMDNLKAGGNSWSTGRAPPPPPGVSSKNPHGSRSKSNGEKGGGKSGLSGLAIAGIVFGILLALAIVIALFSKRSSPPPPSYFLDEEGFSNQKSSTPMVSRELSGDKHPTNYTEFRPSNASNSTDSKALQKSPSGLRLPSALDGLANRLSIRRNNSIHATAYSLADLQSATRNFATASLLGEGSVGRVYKAKYADGKVFAVKKISSSFFQDDKKEYFIEVVSSVSKLRHPNIAGIVGYCSEQGHNMLMYEYFRNGSLHQFLHLSDDFSRPLTWNTRVKIALGTARAIEYFHEVCSPPMVHKNIKSSNILLDAELSPHLSDYGFAACHQRTSQNLGVGYNAPECTRPSAYTLKSDVYSFGVVMLEVMTGRMPFDSSRPRSEQCLVRWATPQLHEIDALEKMVDPALRGLYPPKSLSRFADIIALCVQMEPDFRLAMSEVVQRLARLTHGASQRMEDFGN